MRIQSTILMLCVLSGVCGCFYQPWRNESYRCEDSAWIAPHNYKVAFVNRKKHQNVLLGDLVIVPFLVATGEYYNGRSPYHVWLRVYAENGDNAALNIQSIVCAKSGSATPVIIQDGPLSLKLASGCAEHYFKTPIHLDFAGGETATITFSFNDPKGGATNIQRTFRFKPVLQKGAFKSLD